MKSAYGLAAALTLFFIASEASAQTIGGKVRRWEAEIKGDIRVDDEGLEGTNVDVDETFGFDEEEDFDELHVTLGLPIIGRFNYQYLRGEYEGEKTLTANFNFGGQTFAASTRIDARLDFQAHTILWQFGANTPGFIGADVGAGMVAGIKYFDIVAEVDDEFGNQEDTKIKAPVPVIGAYARFALASFIAVEAQVHGISFFDTFDTGLKGIFYDATLAVDVKFKGLFVGAGYRIMRMDVEYENSTDVDVDLELNGIFFEAGFAF